jgi:hypothetical protein
MRAISTLCVLVEGLQSGAIAGGAIIDGGNISQPSSLDFQHTLSQLDCAALYRNLRTGGV